VTKKRLILLVVTKQRLIIVGSDQGETYLSW
jgi:hypothetical protein